MLLDSEFYIEIDIQNNFVHSRNSLHISQELWQYGMREYYRGMMPILIRNGPSNILFFGLRTPLKNALPNPQELWWGHILTDFVSGAFLGAFISTLMYPVNVIKTHQQCQVCQKYSTLSHISGSWMYFITLGILYGTILFVFLSDTPPWGKYWHTAGASYILVHKQMWKL